MMIYMIVSKLRNSKIIIMCVFDFQDPTKNFGLPSVGRLSKYVEPTHIPQVSTYKKLCLSVLWFLANIWHDA